MKQIQFIQITPEELQILISNSLKQHLEEIEKKLQKKNQIEYLTQEETAKVIKGSISTVHNYTKKGILLPYGIGGKVLYKKHEVEQAIIPLYQ